MGGASNQTGTATPAVSWRDARVSLRATRSTAKSPDEPPPPVVVPSAIHSSEVAARSAHQVPSGATSAVRRDAPARPRSL
ncbi:hypothetical protein SAVIM40S_00913 [Streptomyces avidinii]